MARLYLDPHPDDETGEPTGRWIDPDATTWYEEALRFDGRNHVSLHTTEEFRGRQLGRTARGQYVIRAWSQWQGERNRVYPVTSEEAADWFARNESEDHEIPRDLRRLVADAET